MKLKDVKIEFKESSKYNGAKFASVKVNGSDVNVAVVSGLGNAKALLDDILADKLHLHFVEVMSCEGGCVNGGGIPLTKKDNVVEMRTNGLKEIDNNRDIRKSHENKEVKEFLAWQEKSKNKAHLHTR